MSKVRKVYLIENVNLNYVCDVCSSKAIAKEGLKYYRDTISHGRFQYRIKEQVLIDWHLYR